MRAGIVIAALKAWAIAELVVAATYAGEWRRLALMLDAAAPPVPMRWVAAVEIAYLLCLVPAAGAMLLWWLGHPGAGHRALRRIAGAGIAVYMLLSALTFLAWDGVATAAAARTLYGFDSLVALGGLGLALVLVRLVRSAADDPDTTARG